MALVLPLGVASLAPVALAPVALAEEPQQLEIGFETGAVELEAFQSEALSVEELKDIRGAGLDAGPPRLDSGSETAVILFDELGNGRGNGSSKTSSYNAGLGSQVNSSITGSSNH